MKQPKKNKPTIFLTPLTENPVPKSKMYFFQCKLKDFKSLSRARIARQHILARRYRALSRATAAASGRLMHFLIFGVKWGFWAITLVPDMLEGQTRALSTREIIQFCKQVSAKISAHWIGVQGPSNLVRKTKTPPLCEPVPGEPFTKINKCLFLIEPR